MIQEKAVNMRIACYLIVSGVAGWLVSFGLKDFHPSYASTIAGATGYLSVALFELIVAGVRRGKSS